MAGAYEEAIRSITLDADDSLSGYTGPPYAIGSPVPHNGKGQYRFVKVVGEHACGLADDPDTVVGVLQNKPQVAGEAGTVTIRGVTVCLAAEAINAGDMVTTDADGKAVVTTDKAERLGVATTDCKGEDTLFSLLLML